METTIYFVLGMLSIVAVTFITVTVWGIVKIIKLSKISKAHDEYHMHHQNELDRRFESNQNELDRRFESMDKFISEVERESFSNSKSYTDSRIDKLIDTHSIVGVKKQVIKG
jgi:hypothetical protein